MSTSGTTFDFYLKSPMTIEKIAEMYRRIQDSYPQLEFTCPMEEMVSSSYDIDESSRQRKDPDRICKIIYGGEVEVSIRNRDYSGNPYSYCVRKGERQLFMLFNPVTYKDLLMFIDDNPEFTRALVPMVSIVAEVSDAFFGIYGSYSEFTTKDRRMDATLRDIEHLEAMLDKPNPTWATFYLDNQLFDDIGPHVLQQWAEMIYPADGKGAFVERQKIPLCGSKWEPGFDEPGSTFSRKNAIFHKCMYPKIIKRIRSEYHYDGR